ncbi:hypothetical protein NECAME_11943 [Necator americanus]|uniref:Uncharacterized protein n=1 Tax=Necator americanus TaxID=51031 RepID=W2T249_NECAM|nr:hypothetical protein NECAME_11943 [Necator americanus]ETN76080.1 hypothetical protein NECAME_11943 [Necator americanus]
MKVQIEMNTMFFSSPDIGGVFPLNMNEYAKICAKEGYLTSQRRYISILGDRFHCIRKKSYEEDISLKPLEKG